MYTPGTRDCPAHRDGSLPRCSGQVPSDQFQEVGDGDRFGHVGFAAAVADPLFVTFHRISRDRDHGYIGEGRLLLQPSGHLQPRNRRQLDVHQNKVGVIGAGKVERGEPVARLKDTVALSDEQIMKQLHVQLIILNDEDRFHHGDPWIPDLAGGHVLSPRPDLSTTLFTLISLSSRYLSWPSYERTIPSMSERQLPPEIDQLSIDPARPMLILDVDEVLAMFMLGFERFVGRNGLEMRITRFALFENLYRPGASEPVELSFGRTLFDAFFDTEGDDIDPAVGASDAVRRLSRDASVLILTNAPQKSRENRRRWLATHGFPYPLIINTGPKGEAVAALSARTRGQVAFVDDLLPNLDSVADRAPAVHRFQMVADERLRPYAYADTARHKRIDHWPALADAIADALGITPSGT